MTTRELIALKILGLGTTILYGWSFLWVSLMYLYGGLFIPFRELGFRKTIYFEIFVATISLSIIGLIFFKVRGKTLLKLIVQDIVLVIISLPFFGLITGYFENGFDEPGSLPFVYGSICFMTILLINLNDWIKLKRLITSKL